MTFTLASGETHALPRPLATGDVVMFSCDTVNLTSFKPELFDNTYFNLLSSDGDLLLHITFRRPRNVVFNSRSHEWGWGPEEYRSFQGCFQNGRGDITVTETISAFDIVIDNTLRHTYTKRIFRPTVGVAYWENQPMPFNMFASDLVVSVSYPSISVAPSTTWPEAVGLSPMSIVSLLTILHTGRYDLHPCS
jgi:hypothetical protein